MSKKEELEEIKRECLEALKRIEILEKRMEATGI